MSLWDYQKIEESVTYRALIGPLTIWLKKINDERLISTERSQNDNNEADFFEFSPCKEPVTKDLSWSRWVISSESNTISFFPMMPDRPVVVRPEVPVKIPKGKEAIFYVGIPLWVAVGIDSPENIILTEVPALLLSNIWFGDPMSGELCYSLRSRALRQISNITTKPHRAICPVKIQNDTDSILDIERFCIHVGHLSIYKGSKRLWTNQVNIKFQGEDVDSKINYAQEAPKFEHSEEIIGKIRIPLRKTLLKKSFSAFRLLTGF